MKPEDPTLVATLIKSVPLFADFGQQQLESLLSAFEVRTYDPGQTIFEAGSVPKTLGFLTTGVASVRNETGEVFEVRPPYPIGELSALTGQVRNMTVVATERVSLLAAPVAALEAFLERHGDVAVKLFGNVLRVAGRKIARDERRLREMRDNIISTQQAMKRMRDAILEGEDNPLHAALFEELDALIEQNRKIHYLVEPSRLVPTRVRLNDRSERAVKALSTEWLYFEGPAEGVKMGDDISFTLLLDGTEIPGSGRVERSDGEVIVYLDNLIAEYENTLNQHLARAQLLDFVL